jgi:hypothetical protein
LVVPVERFVEEHIKVMSGLFMTINMPMMQSSEKDYQIQETKEKHAL